MQHYAESIRNYGTTDNYNTEYTERLHIDLAKDAYNSTNFKDEFAELPTLLRNVDLERIARGEGVPGDWLRGSVR